MILDVVTPSDDISAPFICQTILNGISPLGTMHDIWANAPTFCADSSNLNGKICGSSNNIKKKRKKNWKSTVLIPISSPSIEVTIVENKKHQVL
jgi:hypothetical protein